MLYKTRARNARPYGYGVIMRSSFFRNIVGARIARPLLEFVQNFGFAHLLFHSNEVYAHIPPSSREGDRPQAVEGVTRRKAFSSFIPPESYPSDTAPARAAFCG